jgi:regulator of cell morphogenesis and NO signaling
MGLTRQTIGELAASLPESTRLFEHLGIDYCCGGGQTLSEACENAGADLEEVKKALEEIQADRGRNGTVRNWQREPLSELIAHIVGTHHGFVREETARLRKLLSKVCSVHGGRRPELMEIQAVFGALQQELFSHLHKEEAILFPAIHSLEKAANGLQPVFRGSLACPLQVMFAEHDNAGEALRRLRSLSADYSPPEDACISYKTLYAALAEFEENLHQHIHLENNILFPRASQMEEELNRV